MIITGLPHCGQHAPGGVTPTHPLGRLGHSMSAQGTGSLPDVRERGAEERKKRGERQKDVHVQADKLMDAKLVARGIYI